MKSAASSTSAAIAGESPLPGDDSITCDRPTDLSADFKVYASNVYLKTTPMLLAFFDAKIPGHKFQERFPSAFLSKLSLNGENLTALMRGTAVAFPEKQPKPINIEHEARMKILRDRMEEQSYQNLVRDTADSSLADTRTELRELKNQLSTVINVLISIFTAVMASWYWTPHWTTGSRVLGALGSALGLGAIEAFLYFRYLAKIEQSKNYEAKTKSRSRVKESHKMRGNVIDESKKER